MLQNTHFGAGSDALQQVHGAGVKSYQPPDALPAETNAFYTNKSGFDILDADSAVCVARIASQFLFQRFPFWASAFLQHPDADSNYISYLQTDRRVI